MTERSSKQLPFEGFRNKNERLKRASRVLTNFKRLPKEIRSERRSRWSSEALKPVLFKGFEIYRQSTAALLVEESGQNVECIAPEMTQLESDKELIEVLEEGKRQRLTTKDVVAEIAQSIKVIRYQANDNLGLSRRYQAHLMPLVTSVFHVGNSYVRELDRQTQKGIRKISPNLL